jgi:hydrogenase maturation protein HypF
MSKAATKIQVNGIVQGVGFRPFVYRLANQFNLVGHITNNGEGVSIIVAGESSNIDALTHSLQSNAPPLARIISLHKQETTLSDQTTTFSIIDSETGHQSNTHVSPDITTCTDCRLDITSPTNRRYQYPFTNCTNCGPRYSIIRTLPYDRSRTTMDIFTMCPACQTEYNNPLNRRFHAQPNACDDCGPKLEWKSNNDKISNTDNPLDQAIEALADDQVIGIKGLGGFHLAVNAFSSKAVNKLRDRKQRPTKPLAVMVKDIDTARQLCSISQHAEQELT